MGFVFSVILSFWFQVGFAANCSPIGASVVAAGVIFQTNVTCPKGVAAYEYSFQFKDGSPKTRIWASSTDSPDLTEPLKVLVTARLSREQLAYLSGPATAKMQELERLEIEHPELLPQIEAYRRDVGRATVASENPELPIF